MSARNILIIINIFAKNLQADSLSISPLSETKQVERVFTLGHEKFAV